MAVNGVGGDRNYTSMLDGTASTNKVYDAVFGNADDNQLSSDDFYTLMITQLTNQDFMNPVDDTQYIAQMAQFSTRDQMMELLGAPDTLQRILKLNFYRTEEDLVEKIFKKEE